MIYVGIDVAKSTHYAAAMNSEGVVLLEPFAFANDAPGFASLLGKVSGYPKEDLLFGLESTSNPSLRFRNPTFRASLS